MALYVSAARRRRRLVLAALVALVVGLGLGFVAGRFSATSPEAAATTARDRGDRLATRLEALTIEYEQVLKGADTVEGAVLQPLEEIAAGAERAARDAPWIDAADRAHVAAVLAAVRSVAEARGSSAAFAEATAAGSATLRDVFGAGR